MKRFGLDLYGPLYPDLIILGLICLFPFGGRFIHWLFSDEYLERLKSYFF